MAYRFIFARIVMLVVAAFFAAWPGVSAQAQGNVQLSPEILTVSFQREVDGTQNGSVSLSLISGNSATNLFLFQLELADFGDPLGSAAVFISPTTATISSAEVFDVGSFSTLAILQQVPERVDLQLVTTSSSAVGTLAIQFVDTPAEITFFNQTNPLDSVTARVIVGVEVAIDIKPGSDPNSINLCSGGAVPVAILGSNTFDVLQVDTESLRFADAAVKIVGKKDPQNLCSYEDVNNDLIDDLVCHYVTTDIAGVNGESITATLNGALLDGTPIEGSDSVNIVKDTCL